MLFFLSLGLLTVISWIIPLRPTYSEFEKRELTKFPPFSLQALFDGSYFDQIDLWFSDTFPFRDTFITGNSYLRQLYGLHPVQVSGDVEEGDAIPSAPSRPSSSRNPLPHRKRPRALLHQRNPLPHRMFLRKRRPQKKMSPGRSRRALEPC